ncbi:MAG TPA: chorismate mutase [Patescibacteria group bacterium]|nr:chorismate mutase [Patescibacteria group bacterium]
MLRGVRGATTVEANEAGQVIERVGELLLAMAKDNQMDTEDIGAVIFSSTPDLNSAFPAVGARKMGWNEVPLFGTQEIEQPMGLPLCIRILILWNTEKKQRDIHHVYLHGAVVLRQDVQGK